MDQLYSFLQDTKHQESLLYLQLLRNVTIASGGVLPKIHPELLAKKKGGKFVTGGNTPVAVPYKKPIATKPPAHKKVSEGLEMHRAFPKITI